MLGAGTEQARFPSEGRERSPSPWHRRWRGALPLCPPERSPGTRRKVWHSVCAGSSCGGSDGAESTQWGAGAGRDREEPRACGSGQELELLLNSREKENDTARGVQETEEGTRSSRESPAADAPRIQLAEGTLLPQRQQRASLHPCSWAWQVGLGRVSAACPIAQGLPQGRSTAASRRQRQRQLSHLLIHPQMLAASWRRPGDRSSSQVSQVGSGLPPFTLAGSWGQAPEPLPWDGGV